MKSAQPQAEDSRGPIGGLLAGLVGMLLVARLLVPTEAAADGNTLWMVQLWLAAGLLWVWFRWRERDVGVHFDYLDLWLGLLVGGHVLSAVAVVATEGQKRAAINMLWEWVGLGVSFFLIRQILRTSADIRRLILVMVSTATVLAGLGVWQHYVFYPQASQAYQQQRNELDRLLSAPLPTDPQDALRRQQRVREIESDFVRQDIPLDGPGRELFEQRLEASSEPFGMFALANTFAGLLLAWLIVALGGMVSSEFGVRNSILHVPNSALMAFCLLLTKSRTAVVGLLAGLVVWLGWNAARVGIRGIRLSWKWVIAACLLTAAAVTVAWFSGGLDRQVLTEAEKSMRYRLQYWQATCRVIREHPICGTGPGNFRQHYLKYKLPESSEEIADPHNVLLSVWTSGGLLGVIGLLGLLGAGWGAFRENREPVRDGARPLAAALQPLTVGAVCGFLIVFAWQFLQGEGLDWRLPILGAAWIAVIGLLQKASNATAVSNVCLGAAFAAVLVHLLGAGGIEMPAIVQTLIVLLALGSAPLRVAAQRQPTTTTDTRFLMIGSTTLLLVAFVLCFFTALRPVLNRNALLMAGEQAWMQDRDIDTALRFYRDAAEHDPFSPEPLRRMAELMFYRWQMSPAGGDQPFGRAVELQRLAISRDPDDPSGYRTLGEWYLARFARTGRSDDARSAVAELQQAVRRYPNNAALRAELAEAQFKAGSAQHAAAEADRALHLDAINHREGHRDKYLSDEVVQALQGMSDGASSGNRAGDRN